MSTATTARATLLRILQDGAQIEGHDAELVSSFTLAVTIDGAEYLATLHVARKLQRKWPVWLQLLE